ncbi:uncharacterized protein LOC134087170 [Sardina pilchardus]|uniref:uncharacterized protein LOC134087170 n=1 Tax=Sardina pilchardus TaxID=27697 RepID=UPI002E0D5246
MRVLLTLLVCLRYGVYTVRGQQRTDVSGHVLLQLYFDPFYNQLEKACCKSYSSGCRVFLNNRGYVDIFYKDRVSLREFDGGMEVRIWNLQRGDAGYYRCTVIGTGTLIYKDTYVEILDTVARLSPLPPSQQPSNQLTTSRTFSTSAVETSAVLSDVHEKPRLTWREGLLVGAGCSLVLMTVISVVVVMTVLHHRKRLKDKYSRKQDDSTDPMLSHSEEVAPIIYTVVDFKPYEETSELYANVCMHSPRTTRTKTPLEPLDTVEYSTVASSL